MPEPDWIRRFRAPTFHLLGWALDAPERCLYLSNASGRTELHTWDRTTGVRTQATDRPAGTMHGKLTPDGESLWWFDDTKGSETGGWRVQAFGAEPGDAAPAATVTGFPTGLDFGPLGIAALGLSGDDRHRIHVVSPDGTERCVYDGADGCGVVGWSRDGAVLVFNHADHGDFRNQALRAVADDGTTIADLWDGAGKGLTGFGFSPVAGDSRCLIAHERRGHRHPAVWDPRRGTVEDLAVDVADVELVGGDWYPNGGAVLLRVLSRGRARLLRHDVEAGSTEDVTPIAGMITNVRVRPDGEIWWSGSDARTAPAVHCGAEVLGPSADEAPEGVGFEDLDVEGPGGTVHAFLARPMSRPEGPMPTVFQVHGGPTGVDTDAYAASTQAFVDHGFAVVRVNYRGSSGYGKAWQDAIVGKPGYRELEDLAAVRDHVVGAGIADPDRLAILGGSWGGYLTLLAIGTQPDRWSAGVSVVPLASLRDHYHQQGEVLQAYWRALFGGTPESLGEALDDIDPIAHVGAIRVPVHVTVGDNDPRCPLPQVLTYIDALAAAGVDHDLYRYDAGHAVLVVDEQIENYARWIDWLATKLGTPPAMR